MNLLETIEPVAATGLFSWAWLMIATPAIVAAMLLLAGKVADAWGHLLAVAAVLFSFAIAAVLFVQQLGADAAERAVSVPVYTWFTTGEWTFEVGLLVDQLSILFALLVTGVGSLIHIYSIGYMSHDDRRRRFFAYMNLFLGSMLILVLGDNPVVMFVGWEGVDEKFSPEALATLLDNYPSSAKNIFEAYNKGLFEGKQKN